MAKFFFIDKLKITVERSCDCVRERYDDAMLVDIVSNEKYHVILNDGDVLTPLEVGQLVIAELVYDTNTPPWDRRFFTKSFIKALDKKVVDLKHKKRQVK